MSIEQFILVGALMYVREDLLLICCILNYETKSLVIAY